MRRYHFRLQTVLRVRQVEEALARQEVGRANKTLHELEGAEAHLRTRYDDMPKLLPPLEAPMFHALREEAVRLGAALTNASDAVAAARLEQLQALHLLGQARTRVRTLEHLDTDARAQWRLEVEKDERDTLDDLSNSGPRSDGAEQ